MLLLEDLKVYRLAMDIDESVFQITINWDVFNKKN